MQPFRCRKVMWHKMHLRKIISGASSRGRLQGVKRIRCCSFVCVSRARSSDCVGQFIRSLAQKIESEARMENIRYKLWSLTHKYANFAENRNFVKNVGTCFVRRTPTLILHTWTFLCIPPVEWHAEGVLWFKYFALYPTGVELEIYEKMKFWETKFKFWFHLTP